MLGRSKTRIKIREIVLLAYLVHLEHLLEVKFELSLKFELESKVNSVLDSVLDFEHLHRFLIKPGISLSSSGLCETQIQI